MASAACVRCLDSSIEMRHDHSVTHPAHRSSSWLEISRSALGHNLLTLRSLIGPSVNLAPVVKADAYGHGMRLCSEVCVAQGADLLCVNELAEAERLADLPVPIYVVGPTFADEADAIAAVGCQVVSSSLAHVDALARAGVAAGRSVGVHIKVETGTHRQGLPTTEARALADHVLATPGVSLAGMATHLADVEDETEHTFARVQLDRFDAAVAGLPAGVLRHCAASAAHLLLPRSRYDMVRPGIAAYGLWPSVETRIASSLVHGEDAVVLQPALTWKTRISEIKTVPAGGYVGYGRTLRLPRESRIAIIPVGYWDGFDRALSGRGSALVSETRVPLAGRVCMNMSMLDITGVSAEVGDEVVLIGQQGDQRITVEELAGWADTINYEVVARLHPRLDRLPVT
jgi:alanine racemase